MTLVFVPKIVKIKTLMKHKNTLRKGRVRYIIFKEKGTWYGVALEFNLVEEGDNPEEVMASLFQAIRGYVETVQKVKVRSIPLNQTPDKEYEYLWNSLNKEKMVSSKTKDKKEVFSFGYNPLGSLVFV